jgi:hypothetical protein
MIFASVDPVPPDLPAVAGFYSQLAGVLAGFGFAGLIALITAQLATNSSAGKILESGGPLLASFVALVVSSLNYAVVAGEVPGSGRVAAVQTLSGLGFSVAGVTLLYSVLILVRGLETDVPQSRQVTQAMASLIRVVVIFVTSPLVILLMWSGVRDHIVQKYGAEAGFTELDWVALAVLVGSLTIEIVFAARLFGKPERHSALVRGISYVAVILAAVSILSATALISFTDSSTQVPDMIPLVAVVLVGGFTILVAYSASRFSAS